MMLRSTILLGLVLAAPLAMACPSMSPEWRAALLARVNALRAKGDACARDFPAQQALPVHWNTTLEDMAADQALWIAQLRRLEHAGRNGEALTVRARQGGYNYARIAENLAFGFRTEAEVLNAWRDSAGHCRNLFEPYVTEIALVCHAAPGGPWWVMTLGLPQEFFSQRQ